MALATDPCKCTATRSTGISLVSSTSGCRCLPSHSPKLPCGSNLRRMLTISARSRLMLGRLAPFMVRYAATLCLRTTPTSHELASIFVSAWRVALILHGVSLAHDQTTRGRFSCYNYSINRSIAIFTCITRGTHAHASPSGNRTLLGPKF